MMSGIVTLVAMLSFIGLVFWAYSLRNRDRFDEASRLPLGDEDHIPATRNDRGAAAELPPCCRGDRA